MSDVAPFEPLLADADERLETAPTLVDFVQQVNVDLCLRDADAERFKALRQTLSMHRM